MNMEKDASKVPPESKDNNETEDISALINSVLEKLSNIAEQTTNAQQDMEEIINQMDIVQEEVNAPLESNDNDILPKSKDNSNDNNVLSQSNGNGAHPESKDSNGTKHISASINSPMSNDSSGTDDISALINSVVESLSNIAEETARAQKEMESIKNLVEKDDNNDSFPGMPKPGAPGPGRPLPDFPSPYPDPQPDPFNDPKPGPFWEQDNSEK